MRIKTTTIVSSWLALSVGCTGGGKEVGTPSTDWSGTSDHYTGTIPGIPESDTGMHETMNDTNDTGVIQPPGITVNDTGDTSTTDSGFTGTTSGTPSGDTGL